MSTADLIKELILICVFLRRWLGMRTADFSHNNFLWHLRGVTFNYFHICLSYIITSYIYSFGSWQFIFCLIVFNLVHQIICHDFIWKKLFFFNLLILIKSSH